MHLDTNWRREVSELWPEVSYEIRPLKTWAFQKIVSFVQADGIAGDGSVSVDGPSLIQEAWAILPEHVRDIQGLTIGVDGEKKPVTPEMLLEHSAMIPLVTEMIVRLVNRSTLKEGDEKNSGRPSPSDSAAAASGKKEGA